MCFTTYLVFEIQHSDNDFYTAVYNFNKITATYREVCNFRAVLTMIINTNGYVISSIYHVAMT